MSFGIELPSETDWALNLDSFDYDYDLEPFSDASNILESPMQANSPQTTTQQAKALDRANATTPAKVGTRFSTASLKILKDWLQEHADHPYPSSRDVKRLEAQTGLDKQQITTWYANMRRRTKGRHIQRPTSPSLAMLKNDETQAQRHRNPQSIPRVPTQSPFWDMDPMQRWRNSPPEHEASTASDILAAVQSSDPHSHVGHKAFQLGYHERWTSDDACSAGSARRSQSSAGSSLDSANTYASHDSSRSIDPLKAQRRRRRRRKVVARDQVNNGYRLSMPVRTFQCTFCAETFSTKHNWKRHEKSIHISLEGWECSPSGPTTTDDNQVSICVYCCAPDPDEAHIKAHDFEECEQREPEERIFYRKDNLQQHLMLIHRAAFQDATMRHWKRENQLIRSRCGFCGLNMETWDERVDHIAEHFKMGRTMADWEGGWGFDPHVADKVESAIPPYGDLIHYERSSPWPFTSFQGPHETPVDAFELICIEMDSYLTDYVATRHRKPTINEMQYECCTRIFCAELRTASYSRSNETEGSESWLRDLIMANDTITREARRRPSKYTEKVSCTSLHVIGKATVFESCALERDLQHRLRVLRDAGSVITDSTLREEAVQVLDAMMASTPSPSKCTYHFLKQLIHTGSPAWVTEVRQRAGLLDTNVDLKLETLMHESYHGEPAEDTWDESLVHSDFIPFTLIDDPDAGQVSTQKYLSQGLTADAQLGDDSCYRMLMKELTRFVRSSMSLHNPNRHVPTDEELQHQARWIMYDDGDPWNQTPVDNPDWLLQFKKDQGLA